MERIEDPSAALDAMYKDYLKGPAVYHPSKFWDKLARMNIEWLREDGVENFKRTVNNNYFNWMVSLRSPYFKRLLRTFIGKNKFRPLRLLGLLGASIPKLSVRTYVKEGKSDFGFWERKIYAVYVTLLYRFVLGTDVYRLLEGLEEPEAGNPITVRVGSKRASQDICNSYLEYSYIRSALGKRFDGVKRVAEIGAGYGRLAYVFKKLHPGMKYVIVDIPPALYVAQWYFGKVFPGAALFKYRDFGDYAAVREELEAASVCFLLPHQLALLPDRCVDLMINVSSFQEMAPRQIAEYYDAVHRKSSYFYTKQWIYWENPEDKISVPAVIYPTNPRWSLIAARLNPVHAEFFEALFETRPASAGAGEGAPCP